MCIRRETREKARRSLAFSRVSKPHTHITHMLRQCTSIVYLRPGNVFRIRYLQDVVTTYFPTFLLRTDMVLMLT